MENKQTAVDLYEEKSRELIYRYISGDIDKRELLTRHHNIYYDIKEMERQQMKEMYLRGIENYDPTFKRKGSDIAKRLKTEMPKHIADYVDAYAEQIVNLEKSIIDEKLSRLAENASFANPILAIHEAKKRKEQLKKKQ